MELIIGGLIVLVLIGLASRNRSRDHTQLTTSPSPARRAYADIIRNGQFVTLSAAEVAAMFAPFNGNLRKWRSEARPVLKAGNKAHEKGVFVPSLLNQADVLLQFIRQDTDAIDKLMEEISFETDAAYARYSRLQDAFDELAGEVEEAIENMLYARDHPEEWK